MDPALADTHGNGYACGRMIVVIHRACNGPALEPDEAIAESCALPVTALPFSCFTCLDEIMDESELRLSEEIRM
jgi:hypothetical protein